MKDKIYYTDILSRTFGNLSEFGSPWWVFVAGHDRSQCMGVGSECKRMDGWFASYFAIDIHMSCLGLGSDARYWTNTVQGASFILSPVLEMNDWLQEKMSAMILLSSTTIGHNCGSNFIKVKENWDQDFISDQLKLLM